MNEEEYLEQRVLEQINWYDRKSSINKIWFIRLKIFETILALLIPFLTGYITANGMEMKFLVGLIGVIVAVVTNLITLLKFQENWIKYRSTAESLKHERFLYITKAGPYKGQAAFPEFVERFESYISKENTEWISYIRYASEREKDNSDR
jgi:hypothetical protein